ncbi:MAG: hypothetical protein ABEJ31_06915 [Haloarculaceae archaeon]
MSAEPRDRVNDQGGASECEPRCIALETGDGLVLYDRHNHQAWLQSADPVAVTERR